MKVLLVAATEMEIQPFSGNRTAAAGDTAPGLLITGVGLTAATYQLTRRLQQGGYDLVVQAGLAGSFDHNLSPGTVVTIGRDAIADQVVAENGVVKDLFDLGLTGDNSRPYQQRWLVNPALELLQRTGLPVVTGISVNEITTDPVRIGWYAHHMSAATESMEGAALHYCCLMENIPFLQLRAVSNFVGEREKVNWKIRESIDNLNAELKKIIAAL